MKKLGKILLTFLFAIVLATPFALVGCNDIKEGIEIHTNFNTDYKLGEELDLLNGKITYTDEKGKETILEITSDMVTSFNTSRVGSYEMIITYEGYTITVPYTVSLYDVDVETYYYCAVSAQQYLFPQDGYMVVKFDSQTSARFYFVVDTRDITSVSATEVVATCTSSIVNNKIVYEASWDYGDATVTVLNGTQIQFVSGDLSKTMTQYVAD